MQHSNRAIEETLYSDEKVAVNPHTHLVPAPVSVIINALLYKEKNRAEIALNSISDAVVCTDIHGNIDYLNIAAEILTGWTRSEAYGHPIQHVFNVINGTTRLPCSNPVQLVLQTDKPVELAGNILLIKRDGSEISIKDSASPIHNAEGELTGVVIVFHDLNTSKAVVMKMAHLAQHDFLTNLPNRVLLNDRIAHAIEAAKRNNTQIALLFLDLDNFKYINDSLGHDIGDQVLQQVTASLNASVRGSDTVSRTGGDEFVILLADSKNGEDAALTAEKILELFNLPHILDNHQLHVSTSIGISVYPTDGMDAETLIKNADTAMYSAKENGRNNYQFFKPVMNTRAVERQSLETSLRMALEKNELVLIYQPKFNLSTSALTGVEALIRWQHPEWGEVMPERFVPVAEDSGLMIPIGRWVIRSACLQMKRWIQSGFPNMTVAVNISASEFLHKDFVSHLQAILLETGVDAHCLALEITETVLMRDAKASAIILHQLKAIGVVLVVDDFGTGYSSLSYLQQFPIDVLKIDRSFVTDIQAVTDEGIIVSAIISMGNSLKLKVIAEGIETAEQLAFLVSRHCHEGQGYLFSSPVTSQQLTHLMLNPSAK
ncbi:MAG: EAL domain-containing protein [Methylophilus sp.]|nr:EAL domain-containing protein [Methylophilus sp.]